MAGLLLETKLFLPTPRRNAVSRPRLQKTLERALESRLTLVSAPPGFGKTTLLAGWIAATPPETASFAWLSLDEQDNEPFTFWTYVVAALQHVEPKLTAIDAEAYLQTGQPSAIQAVLSVLINELSGISREIVLVLDDYHVIGSPEIHEAVAFLLDHMPACLHLVVASRADPPLPLPRLRARGELTELRASDLRFRSEEAAAYFNNVLGLSLAPGDLAALEERTEGWIAALQLAALSMEGRDDVSGFIGTFAGDNRYIIDYLVQEVLQRQPEATRSFLLQTAVLDRLKGPLCDAVTGRADGEAMLRFLEQSNVFLVPLDDRREWYRYHHLFADVLRAHLAAGDPATLDELHRRASSWFEQHGDRADAIRHALAADNYERAAALVELASLDMLRARQDGLLLSWFRALPEQLLRDRPVLCVNYVALLLHRGDLDAVESLLQDAERSVEAARAGSIEAVIYVDNAQFRELPGMLALYRAACSQLRGNLEDTVTYARMALDRMSAENPLRGGAMALLGLTLWANGDLEGATRTYADGIALTHSGGFVNDSSTIMLADMRVAQGHLREAFSMYERSLQHAEVQGKAAPIGTADLHVGISEILREWDDTEAAADHLARSRQLGELAGLPENRYRWFTAMASVREAQEDYDAALELLRRAEGLYTAGFSPNLRPIPALRARLSLRRGDLAGAEAWARQQGLTADDNLSYLHEFQHFTLARLLIVRGESTARGLLQRLLDAAEAGGRGSSAIEALVLLALAERAAGDLPAALGHLQRALQFAEPEGYVRVFLDEGQPLRPMLEQLSKRDGSHARRILARSQGTHRGPVPAAASDEALSARELEVMRLLGTDLTGPDIARELVVSLNTVRTHTKNIYTKLGVNGRRAAVRRAHELHLL